MPHIKRKNPLFTGLVYIEADLYNSLDARYRQVLESFKFNIILKQLSLFFTSLLIASYAEVPLEKRRD